MMNGGKKRLKDERIVNLSFLLWLDIEAMLEIFWKWVMQ